MMAVNFIRKSKKTDQTNQPLLVFCRKYKIDIESIFDHVDATGKTYKKRKIFILHSKRIQLSDKCTYQLYGPNLIVLRFFRPVFHPFFFLNL